MSDPLLNQTGAGEETRVASGAIAPLRRDDFDRDVWCLMGLPIDAADITRALAEIDDAARSRRQLSFVTPNVNFLVRAMQDATARQEILNADLSLVDGAPLVKMAKMLGVPVTSRVAGSDVFEALRRRPAFAGKPLKVFFFGGRPGAAEGAYEALNRDKGGIEAVGWHNPGFGDVESMSSEEIIAKINACEPDFVMVALGAAKGQAWIEHNRDRLTAPVTAHLGAVVDFTAGGVERAPVWVQRAGLEWAWRIKEEPSLWKRYFKDGLALSGLILTGLAPQAGAGRDVSGEVQVETEITAQGTVIRLSGQIGQSGLKSVREAFRAAAARGYSTRLDFSGAKAVDRAFLGQVLMLEKHLAAAGAKVSVSGANTGIKTLFRANKMNYVHVVVDERAAPQSGGAREAAV